MNKRELILISILIISLVCISLYGIRSDYALSGDTPPSLEYLKGLGDNSNNLLFYNSSQNFHKDEFFSLAMIISTLKPTLFSNTLFRGDIFSYLNNSSKLNLDTLYYLGIIGIIFFCFSWYILARKILKSRTYALLSLVLLFVLSEIPLIRWSGLVSIHGMLYNFYFPQFFAYSLMFLSIFSALSYAQSKLKSWLILLLILSTSLMIYHLFTGIFTLVIISAISIFLFFDKMDWNFLIILGLEILSLVLSLLWPFYSINSYLLQTHSYLFLFIAIIAIIASSWLVILLKDKFKNRYKIYFDPLVILVLCYSFLLTLIEFGILLPYLSFQDVNLWFLFLLPIFIPIFIYIRIFLSEINEENFLLLFWLFSPLFIYFVGSLNLFQIKVFWRFLFIAKFPAIILLTLLIKKYGVNVNYKRRLFILFTVLIIIFQFTILTVNNSQIGNYFQNVPTNYKLPTTLQNGSDLVISEPLTNSYIQAITNNTVISIDPAWVIDNCYNDDMNRIQDNYNFLYNISNNLALLNEYNPKYILYNKGSYAVYQNILFSYNNPNTQESITYFIHQQHFKIIQEDNNFLLLGK